VTGYIAVSCDAPGDRISLLKRRSNGAKELRHEGSFHLEAALVERRDQDFAGDRRCIFEALA
jgi:hypothetical protein